MARRRTKALDVCLWMALVLLECMTTGVESIADLTLRFTQEPEDVVALKLSGVLLNCSATSSANDSRIDISWRRNGDMLHPDGKRLILNSNGSLWIRSFGQQRYDEGLYECVAKSGNSALVSRQAHLQVAALGHFSGHLHSFQVARGRNARLECTISGGVPKPTVTWRKNGQPLPKSERIVQLPSVLQLVNVTSSDAGRYSCHATNSLAQERTSNYTEVTVYSGDGKDAFQLLSRPRDQEIELGRTVQFECFPSHGRLVVNWTRKDGAQFPTDRARFIGNGNLEIRNVQESDAGNYGCEVHNMPALRAEATLFVFVRPRLIDATKADAQIRAKTIMLTCNFTGFPKPMITWLKNGQLVRSYGRIKVQGNSLIMGQSTDSDTALYQCWAENQIGRAGAVISLSVTASEHNPNAPTGLRARAVDSRSIKITWENSSTDSLDSDHAIVAYSVQFWPLLGGEEIQHVVLNNDLTISKLQPYTNYTFYVRAYNKFGASEHSQYVVQATDEDVPIAAPEVHVFPSSATSLRVSWKELPPSEARGVIVNYRVFYRMTDEEVHNITLPGDVHEFEIPGLIKDKKYSVRVLAATKSGYPRLDEERWPWVSQIVSETTHVGVLELPNLKMYLLNETTVRITWDTPESLGRELFGFKIYWAPIGEEPKFVVLVEDVVEHTLYGLNPDTVYEIKIGAFTDEVENEDRYFKQTLRTLPVVRHQSETTSPPPVPVILEVRPVNETAIHLSWVVPSSEVDAVTYYTVSYVALVPDDAGRPTATSVNCTAAELVLADLRPYTEYQLAVVSHTKDGSSQMSKTVTCRTEEGCPPGLTDLTWFLQEPTVVQLNWKIPKNSNNFVQKYVVTYCEDRFAVDHPWKTHIENGSLCRTVLQGLKSKTVYQVRMHAENRKGVGPASSIKVTTGFSVEPEVGGISDRLMGIIIGIGISGGCIIICVIIFLTWRRCSQPTVATPERNGFPGSLHSNGCIVGRVNDKHNIQEADGTTPMLKKSKEFNNTESKLEMSPNSKHISLWSSVDNGRTKSTSVV